MPKRTAARMPAALLTRLAGRDDELDFGIYRRLRVLRGELERLLAVDLPAAIERALGPADTSLESHALVYDLLDRLAERWQQELVDCCPARRLAGRSPAAGYHVHATSPLEFYAFRLPSGRRVVFQLRPIGRASRERERPEETRDDPACRRLMLSQQQPIRVAGDQLFVGLEHATPASRRRQSVINAEICAVIADSPEASTWRDELLEPCAAGKGAPAKLHEHLNRFTSWPDDDWLLPCGLQPRLRVHLESLVSEEVWSPAAIDALEAGQFEVRRTQARLLREFAERIIDWFERRAAVWSQLWQQPPRVARTDYLCTLDRLPPALMGQVLASDAQWARWNAWFGLSADRGQRAELLARHPHLVVDTALYPPAFTDELLAGQGDVERRTSGVLVHGENSAALRLLAEEYTGRVAMCTIDPPYNTGIGVWSFADRFAHDAWSRMMEDRVELAGRLLSDEGALFVVLDDHEQARLRLLLERVFGEENFLATIVWEKVHTRKNSARHFSVSHDYIHCFARDKRRWRRQLLPRGDTQAYSNHDGDPRGPWKPDPVYANKPYSARYQIAKPNGVLLDPPPGRYWRYSQRALLEKAARQEIVWGEGAAYPLVKRYLEDAQAGLVPVTLFDRQFAGDNAEANAEMRALFGRGALVSYPKPSRLVYRLAQIATTPGEGQVVLDFFAGSGSTAQAVLALNRADGGRRQYVLVEKGECFDSVLLPRVAKCIFAERWKNGRPEGSGTSQLVKVIRLESFEAAMCQ